MLDKKLLSMLVCPLCKSPLYYRPGTEQSGSDQAASEAVAAELICYPCALAYPVRDEIPVMLDTDARTLTPEEKANRKQQ